MGELRKDYVSEKFVILPNSTTTNYANTNTDEYENKKTHDCPLCPGNEHLTEPSLLSLISKDGMLQRLSDSDENIITDWCVRVFEHKKPFVTQTTSNLYSERPLYSEPAYGHHQIIVATDNHDHGLQNISVEQWANVLLVIQDRVRYLYTQKKVTYVAIYSNNGNSGGSEYDHCHFNIMTFSEIPPVIESEAASFYKYINENGNCPACVAISIESDGPRQILSTENFIAFCPWASTYPYEFSIYPKKHSTSFSKITQKDINDLAMMLRATLGGLYESLDDVSYNLVFHLSPEKKNSKQIHWHLEIYPQIKSWSGLERGFGIFVNNIKPEYSAEVLGSKCRKELAKLVGIT